MIKCNILLSFMALIFSTRSFADENFVIHSVQKGHTLSEIATTYYSYKSMQTLIQAVNKIADANKIVVGQKLVIPTSSNFFLRQFNIHDQREKPVFCAYKNPRTSQVYVALNIATQKGEGNFRDRRFLLVCISKEPYKLIFDSFSIAQTYKHVEYISLLDNWKIIDLDGDGDVDILGEFVQGSVCNTTHYCFHLSKDTYVPYGVIKDESLGFEQHSRDKKGCMIFRYQLRLSEKTVVVEWARLKKKGPLTKKC